eukprot:IDg7315t1
MDENIPVGYWPGELAVKIASSAPRALDSLAERVDALQEQLGLICPLGQLVRGLLKERNKERKPKGRATMAQARTGRYRKQEVDRNVLEVQFQLGLWVCTIYAVEGGVREHSAEL